MQFQAPAHPLGIEQLIEQVLSSRRLTRAEAQWFNSLLATQEALSEDQHVLVQRVLYGLRHNLLQLTD